MRRPRNTAICLISLLFLLGSAAHAEQEESTEKSRRAEQYYNSGYMMTLRGRFEEAIRLYEKSLEIQPTAEAHTYMGWTYSHMRNLKRAIEEAEKAIRIDPDFGNPYNQKAMRAKRYCCYQFPHYNMGRIYLRKNMYQKARREFQKSLAIDPDYAPASEALELLKQSGMQEI
jgi:tetratricopeptide (TPR) repeat protein